MRVYVLCNAMCAVSLQLMPWTKIFTCEICLPWPPRIGAWISRVAGTTPISTVATSSPLRIRFAFSSKTSSDPNCYYCNITALLNYNVTLQHYQRHITTLTIPCHVIILSSPLSPPLSHPLSSP